MKTKKFKVLKAFAIIFAIFTLVFMVALYFTFRPEALMSFVDKIQAFAAKLHIDSLAEGQSYLLFGAFGSFVLAFIFMCTAFKAAKKEIFFLKGGIKHAKKDNPQVVNNYFVNSTETNIKKVNKGVDIDKKEKKERHGLFGRRKKIEEDIKNAAVETKEEVKDSAIKNKNAASSRVDDIINNL